MADYIKREDAIEEVTGLVDSMSICASRDVCRGMRDMKNRALTALSYLPAEDVVEVVRCKDCKWYDENTHTCELYGVKHWSGFFCADGGRSENDG